MVLPGLLLVVVLFVAGKGKKGNNLFVTQTGKKEPEPFHSSIHHSLCSSTLAFLQKHGSNNAGKGHGASNNLASIALGVGGCGGTSGGGGGGSSGQGRVDDSEGGAVRVLWQGQDTDGVVARLDIGGDDDIGVGGEASRAIQLAEIAFELDSASGAVDKLDGNVDGAGAHAGTVAAPHQGLGLADHPLGTNSGVAIKER